MTEKSKFAKRYEVQEGVGVVIDGEPVPWWVAMEPSWHPDGFEPPTTEAVVGGGTGS